MPECVRCGDFTDNSADKRYHYCIGCETHFNQIRNSGVIVRDIEGKGSYEVSVTVSGHEGKGGRERSQTEALARGKMLAEQLSTEAIFEYSSSGSQWDLENYLNAHPNIRSDVYDRLSRVPNRSNEGIVSRLKRLIPLFE